MLTSFYFCLTIQSNGMTFESFFFAVFLHAKQQLKKKLQTSKGLCTLFCD